MSSQGAPNYNRILDFVQVPSRFNGTETLLSPDVFNDDPARTSTVNDLDDITTAHVGPADPRFNLRPPFNKISRERDPGRVNLNTVVGRRIAPSTSTPARVWSEVYDGVMRRYRRRKCG